jgi:hypothetical protein
MRHYLLMPALTQLVAMEVAELQPMTAVAVQQGAALVPRLQRV